MPTDCWRSRWRSLCWHWVPANPLARVKHSNCRLLRPRPGVGRHGPIAAELSGGNLFHPLRGAAVPEGQAKAAVQTPARPQTAGKFELTGIFSFGDARGAVIVGAMPAAVPAGKSRAKPKRICREGEPVEGGYIVQEIGADHVVLARGSEKQILPLRKKQEKKP